MSLRTHGSGGALISLAALALVGWPILNAINHGQAVNMAWIVYGLPAAAVVIALGAWAFSRLLRSAGIGDEAVAPAPVRRGMSPGAGIVLGLTGLFGGGWMMLHADGDARTYASDPSCNAGFASGYVRTGACHIEPAAIVDAHFGGRHNTSHYIGLRFNDGSTVNLNIARETSGSVFEGALQHRDNAASVQFFRNHVTQVLTSSGQAITSNMPAEQRSFWALLGIVGGIIGVFSALRATLF